MAGAEMRPGRSHKEREMNGDNSLVGEVIAPDNLMRAWRQVRSNVAVPARPFSKGADGVSVAAFERTLESELARLAGEIRRGTYEPVPVRWLHIPKPAGGQRTIGILAVRDRVAQRAVHQVLAPRLDDAFLPCSYGFRPGRSARDAVEALLAYRQAGDTWALLADVEGCFDGLDHGLLLEAFDEHVGDRPLRRLVGLWLANGHVGRVECSRPVQEPEDGNGRDPWGQMRGALRSVAGGGLAPRGDYEYATYEEAGRARLGSDLLVLGAGLAGPVLRKAARAWPVARQALRSRAVVLGGVGLAVAVAGPLVYRALANRHREHGVGVLQGSALSPLLTNLYLHGFDREITGQGYHLVRYVDDLAISCPGEAEARSARWACIDSLARLRLRLNEDKSGLAQWSHGFEYLGVRLGGR